MTDKQYFPVPLAHLTSPFVPPPPPPATPPPAPAAGEQLPPPAQESTEPFGMLDVEEPPETYAVDEITLMARDPFTLFAHWETTERGRKAAEERLGSEGSLALRLVVPGGPIIDESLPRGYGRGYLPAPHPGAIVIAVLGLRAADGRFEPIASAPPLRVPFHEAEDGSVDWLEIPPAQTRGREIERPAAVRKGPAGEMLGAARAALPATQWLGQAGAATPAAAAAPPETATSNAPTSPAGGRR